MKKELVIGMYGIYGTYNFGCEAIVRGAVKFLRSNFENCKIFYYSYSYDFDKKALMDLDIEIVSVENKLTFFVRAINKILKTVNCKKRIFTIPFNNIINQIDVVLSIGGDIYTIPEYLRQKEKYPYYTHLVDFCNRAISCGKNVIVYGASVGPFGEYKKAVDYFVKNLQKYNIILCREMDTVMYLKNLGLRNLEFFPDPAFIVRLEQNEEVEKKYIGVNLSPQSLYEIYGRYGDEEIESLAYMMDELIVTLKSPILFIPHVIPEGYNGNDFLFLKRVYNKMCKKEYVLFADYSGGFLNVKRQIRQCKMVIAARMHCAINAVCENVPTIFLSYSQKSIGMCKYVYGDDRWAIRLNKLTDELIIKSKNMMDNCYEISLLLKKRNDKIQEYITKNQQILKNYINKDF